MDYRRRYVGLNGPLDAAIAAQRAIQQANAAAAAALATQVAAGQGQTYVPVVSRSARENLDAALGSVIKVSLAQKLRAKGVEESRIARVMTLPDSTLAHLAMQAAEWTKQQAQEKSGSSSSSRRERMAGGKSRSRAKMNGPDVPQFPQMPNNAIPPPLAAPQIGALAASIPGVAEVAGLTALAPQAMQAVSSTIKATGEVAHEAVGLVSEVLSVPGQIYKEVEKLLTGIADWVADLFGAKQAAIRNAIAAANVQTAIYVAQKAADQYAQEHGTVSVFSSQYSQANQPAPAAPAPEAKKEEKPKEKSSAFPAVAGAAGTAALGLLGLASGPVVWVPAAVGGGVALYRWQQKSTK